MSFMIIQNEKTPFQAIKTRNPKTQQIDIFPKGLTHDFGRKIAIFPIFFLTNKGQENVFYDILEGKNAFQAIKTRRPKSPKIDIFNPWFWSKNGHFSNFFFLGNIDQENVFYDILERKNAFLGYKKKNPKKLKN